ncbi:uncharacterized protein PV09_02552 [Verruconis gallopava]|uniref:Uncharacterized protein n=1 Tax=Verruconis gallopava TaxID=253628 RepID=A0A0D1XVR8_9PEZI|nr:uncharacterized protein PV09_02552 [Verruconis gallopava]KIW06876.1 hypothetical protein PV09_02552 [Verruconis gallopava]
MWKCAIDDAIKGKGRGRLACDISNLQRILKTGPICTINDLARLFSNGCAPCAQGGGDGGVWLTCATPPQHKTRLCDSPRRPIITATSPSHTAERVDKRLTTLNVWSAARRATAPGIPKLGVDGPRTECCETNWTRLSFACDRRFKRRMAAPLLRCERTGKGRPRMVSLKRLGEGTASPLPDTFMCDFVFS